MFKFMPMNAYGWCFFLMFTFAYIAFLTFIVSSIYDLIEKLIIKFKEGIKK